MSRVPLDEVAVAARAECGPGDGPALDGFPLLTLAPAQWGAGVREHSRGVPVEDIVRAAVFMPDARAVAERFGIEPDAVTQSIGYLSSL